MELDEEDNPDVRKILFIGLDNAGKTSIILSLLREISKFALIKPTRNAERRTFEFLGMNISEWDLGGHKRYRNLYLEKAHLVFRRTDIVIYVIDIQDHDRIIESYIYLDDIIKKLIKLKIEPPIHVFFHKNDPEISESSKIKVKDTISYLKKKIEAIKHYNKFSFYKTTIFEFPSIINATSEILLSLFPRSEVIKTVIQEFGEKCGVEGIEILDDNSLIIGSYYINDDIKEILNSLSPYFLRFSDGFVKLKNIEDQAENYMIVERLGKYFIFKHFSLIKDNLPYYILICMNEPFLDKFEFNALFNLLRDIISHGV